MTARVVSLVPSVTETLLAWGVVPVAVTRFCEQADLPPVGGTKNPDLDAVVALGPDLVVMDREENRREDAEALRTAGVPVHVTAVRSVDDVGPTLDRLRRALGLDPQGLGVPGPVPRARAPQGRRPRVWVPIWRRPWMSINGSTYGSSLLDRGGAVNVLADHPDPYPTVTPEEIAVLAPDAVLAPTEPYPWAERHRHLFEGVAPMVVVDGHDLFWWGTRTPAALERLATVIGALAATADR
jgi:ABC-type Fe3+-hydroxamate transport system substrate-binding protein